MFEDLFQSQKRRLAALFRRLLGKDAGTDDLLQDLYVQLQSVNFEEVRDVTAYLFAMALNLAKRRMRELGQDRLSDDIDELLFQELTAEEPDLESKVDNERQVKRLNQVLLELPPKCRAVMAMHYWHGKSYGEIATMLEMSPHMVKKYICHALLHCRRRMSVQR